MHAVVVRVDVTDFQGSVEVLRDEIVPRVAQAPGFVSGYWTRKGGSGLSMSVWDTEADAEAAAKMIRDSDMAPGVELLEVEVREVVASA